MNETTKVLPVHVLRLTEQTSGWFKNLGTEKLFEALASDPHLFALGAVADKKACGLLAFRVRPELWDIEWIAVSDRARRRGVATAMLNFLGGYAMEEPAILRCIFSVDDGEKGAGADLLRFFRDNEDFTVATEPGGVYEISYEELKGSSLGDMSSPAESYFSLSEARQRAVRQRMDEMGLVMPEDESALVRELCLCIFDNHRVTGSCFVKRIEKGLELSSLFSADGHVKELFRMLSQLRRDGLARMKPGDTLVVESAGRESDALLQKLFPQAKRTAGFWCAGYDMQEFS